MSVWLGPQFSRTAASEQAATTDHSVITINDKQRGHG